MSEIVKKPVGITETVLRDHVPQAFRGTFPSSNKNADRINASNP